MAGSSDYSEKFVALLTEKFKDHSEFTCKAFSVMPGRKYDRIVAATPDGRNRHVHAFVERATGAVLKSAGWATPTPGVRYTTVERAANHADPHGSYLYDSYLKHVPANSR